VSGRVQHPEGAGVGLEVLFRGLALQEELGPRDQAVDVPSLRLGPRQTDRRGAARRTRGVRLEECGIAQEQHVAQPGIRRRAAGKRVDHPGIRQVANGKPIQPEPDLTLPRPAVHQHLERQIVEHVIGDDQQAVNPRQVFRPRS